MTGGVRARTLLICSFLFVALLAVGLAALLRSATLAAALALAVAVLTGLLASELIARPLRRLRSELLDLARGAYAEPKTEASLLEHRLLIQAVGSVMQELRDQQAALRAERDALGLLTESGAEGLLQINRQGRVVYHNRAAAQLLGLPENTRGQSFNALLRTASLRDWIANCLARPSLAEPFEFNVEDRSLLLSSRPSGDGVTIAIVDLSEIRRLENVRRDFVANVSHELKTPLTAIRGYVETLQQDDLPAEMRAQFLDVIQRNSIRIQRIVDDLLDLSRLQSGGWRPELQQVDAAAIALDVWAACKADARKDIAFELLNHGHAEVRADPGGLRQVYANLFDNALRYTPVGGKVLVRIQPAAQHDNAPQFLEIQVQDSGAGIPRDALPRVFERFYRVDPARSRAEGGTGLGLSIVKHLLERMDGEVTAESELGKGTTIRFWLPAA